MYAHAYFAFMTEELVARFSRQYDGHIFKDKKGLSCRRLFRCSSSNVAICFDVQRGRIASCGGVCFISETINGEEKVDSSNATIDQGKL